MSHLICTANDHPTNADWKALELLAPFSPMNTRAYAEAVARNDASVIVFGIRDGTSLRQGCMATLSSGRLSSHLEIPSLPPVEPSSPLWSCLKEFCQQHGVTELELNTFGSTPVSIPSIGERLTHREREEFIVDLRNEPMFPNLSSNHKRNFKKAIKADLTIKRRTDIDAAHTHVALQNQSMTRRLNRGEQVTMTRESETLRAFLAAGAGELFQAVQGSDVLSSMLVLRSANVGYYQSAGNAPNGMSLGASTYLIHKVASVLAEEGLDEFNLGGTTKESEGLYRFKKGFASHIRCLEAATFGVGPRWKRRALNTLRTVVNRIRS